MNNIQYIRIKEDMRTGKSKTINCCLAHQINAVIARKPCDVAIPRICRSVRKTDKRPNEPSGIDGGLPRPVCGLVSQ